MDYQVWAIGENDPVVQAEFHGMAFPSPPKVNRFVIAAVSIALALAK